MHFCLFEWEDTQKTSQKLAENTKRKEKWYACEERWFWNLICGCYRRLLWKMWKHYVTLLLVLMSGLSLYLKDLFTFTGITIWQTNGNHINLLFFLHIFTFQWLLDVWSCCNNTCKADENVMPMICLVIFFNNFCSQ